MKKNTFLLFFFKYKYVQLYIHIFSLLGFLKTEKANKGISSRCLKRYESKVFSDIIEAIPVVFISLFICQNKKVLIRHYNLKITHTILIG